ncbi:MAG: YggU family protein [Deltaproteobacteria bacterium]|jgi:hypothetical protein|nr:YggU family protein [Deltaproteobacteria bacterium]
MIPLLETSDGIRFQIQVVPRSSRQELVGIQGDCLKIKITSPPLEGRANEECIRFLAATLGVKKSQVSIVGGLKSRKKTVAIKGLARKNAEATLISLYDKKPQP